MSNKFWYGLTKGWAWGFIAASVLGVIILRFSHLELTEGELLVRFWWVWILLVIGDILAALTLRKLDFPDSEAS